MRKLTFNMTMRSKLIVSFSSMLLIFLTVAFFNLYQVGQIKQHMNDQNDKIQLKVMALELKEMVQELNIIASGLEISKKPEYILKYNAKRQPFTDMVKMIGDTASTPEQLKWRSQLIQASVDYINNFDSAAQMVQGNGTNPVDLQINLLYLYNESQDLKDKIFGLVDNFYTTYAESADNAVSESTLLLDQTGKVMLIVASLVFVLTLFIAFIIIRSFMNPITRLQKAVALIAEGDLSHTINSESRDELGQLSRSFDHMIVQVRQMLSAASKIASSLTEHSQSSRHFSELTASANIDILKSIQDISAGANEQAYKTEQSSQIIAELDAEIRAITSYTDDMKRSSEEASAGTLNGTASVRALKASSDRSQEVLSKVDAAMRTLAASSKQIGAITLSITEISTQTNVLSLNAAIEAARAGVHGRGFSVIAEEVRQLSQQTNDSSKTISGMIQTLQQQIRELQSSLNEAKEQTEAQNSRVSDTLDSFVGIEQSMSHITGQIEQIHDKIEQVRLKNDTLVESVQFVAAVAQETAAGVEEVHSTSIQQDASIRQIADQADDIHTLAAQLFTEISKFQIGTEDVELAQEGQPESEPGNEAGQAKFLEEAESAEEEPDAAAPSEQQLDEQEQSRTPNGELEQQEQQQKQEQHEKQEKLGEVSEAEKKLLVTV